MAKVTYDLFYLKEFLSSINFRKTVFLEQCLENLFCLRNFPVQCCLFDLFLKEQKKSKAIYGLQSLGSGNPATVGILNSSSLTAPALFGLSLCR
jgi:hypothetical protein